MPGQPVKIGPFVGGMNTYSGETTIADNEAVSLINLDVDLDGSLLSRPGITSAAPDLAGTLSHVLGTYRSTAGEVFVIVAAGNRVSAFSTSSGNWTVISNSGPFTSCVQYNNKLWLTIKPSGILQGGGKWDPAGGYVAVGQMPRGYSSCVYKERMFVAASLNADDTSINRVKFSNAGNPDTWTSTDFFDVNAGDGDDITKIMVFDSSIVIFKSDSTYVFAYESAPAKGLVQRVNGVIGANNAFCVVEYENNLFVMHEANVYRISNWNWEHANIKIPFKYVNAFATADADASSVSMLGNRILARYYDNYYCLGLKTGAWSKWEFKQRTNVLANPSFETDTSGWVVVGGQATITRDTTRAMSGGAASGRLDTVINSTNAYVTTTAGLIPTVPGEVWTASAYVNGAGVAEIGLIPTDVGGTVLTPILSGTTVPPAGPAQFTRLDVTGTMPPNTAFVRLRLYQRDTSAARSLWYDRALLEKTDTLMTYIEGTKKLTPSEFVTNPNISPAIGAANYYGGSYVAAQAGFLSFIDNKFDTDEAFDIQLVTKSYDFGPSYSFKRLFWWGADILGNATTRFKVVPNVFNIPATWGAILGVPSPQLGTWGRPLDSTLDVSDSASSSNTTSYRTFIKLLKSLRFRQLQFILEATYVGLNSKAAYRIFSLTAIVDSKQIVPKKVS